MGARKLTPVEEFFIDGHIGKQTEKEMAESLGVSLRTVQAYMRRNTVTQSPPAKSQFAEKGGVVSMTQAQSEADDLAAGTSPYGPEDKGRKPYNEEFFKTISKSVHVIDPDKPIR